MKFETLSIEHSTLLLEFENKNKAWFERFIEPRANDFYSQRGVIEHINIACQTMAKRTSYSSILIDNKAIIARANLKDITQHCAYVGYRVAENAISKGVASYCLSQLIDIAQNNFGVSKLNAMVLENNPASMRVLKKHNFKVVRTIPNFLTIHDRALSCSEFCLKLA